MPATVSPTTDLCEDRAWLDGFRAGKGPALERVFRAYAPLVFHVIRTGARLPDGNRIYLRNPAEEDDVLQDCFIRLLTPEARARYDGLRPYGALVRVVARNTLIDHMRKRGRIGERETPLPEDDVMPASPSPAPLTALLSQEESKVAEDLLASLSDDERKLANVRFEQGLSQRDAADALGLSRQNIRTLESKLMDKARAFLKARGW